MKKIAICNVKGGIGKTTTTLMLANILAESKRTLVVDLDAQNSLTSFLVDDYAKIDNKTILEVLTDKINIKDAIIPVSKNLDFIPSDISLVNLGLQLTENRDFKLYSLLQPIAKDYDYILFDTPPAIDLATRLALIPSDIVIIPTEMGAFSKRAIGIVLDYLQARCMPLKDLIKVPLSKVFILPTLFEKNRKLSEILLKELQQEYGSMVLSPISRRSDVQKAAYLGNETNLKELSVYGEYKKIMEGILNG